MASSGLSETQVVNLFMCEDKATGNYVDVDKASEYVYVEDTNQDFIGELDRNIKSDLQEAVLESIRKKASEDDYNVDISIPLFISNCSDKLIYIHTARQFSDMIVMHNHDIIDFFLAGVINEAVKTLFEYSENGNRKYMIFVTLNHENAIERSLNSLINYKKLYIKMLIEANNLRIKQKFYDRQTRKHIEMINMIADYRHDFVFCLVGSIRVIIAPNFVLNYFSSIDSKGIHYHLRADVTNNPGKKNQTVVTRLIPLSIIAVNKDGYKKFKDSSSFDFNALFVTDGTSDDANEHLKTNPNALIGIIPKKANEMLVVPVYSTSDYMKLSIIVSYTNHYEVFTDDMPIAIGKVLCSRRMQVEQTISALTIIRTILFKEQSVDALVKVADDPNISKAVLFNELYRDQTGMEMRYPVLTPIEVADFKLYNEDDFAAIHEGKRSTLRTIAFADDGTRSFMSSDGSIGILSDFMHCNGRVWIDRYWRIHNKVAADIFNKWIMLFAELAGYVRKATEELYLYKDMHVAPMGMTDIVFKEIRAGLCPSSVQMSVKYARFKIFHDFLAATYVNGLFSFDIFNAASRLSDLVSEEIKNDPHMKEVYLRENNSLNIKAIIFAETENEKSLAISKPRSADVIFTNFTTLVNFDAFKGFIDKMHVPPKIKSYIQTAFSTIGIFRSGDVSVSEIEVPHEIPSSRPSSSKDAYKIFYEESAKKIKIISIKNLDR